MPADRTSIVGFNSAWADNPYAPGAVCAIRIPGYAPPLFGEPERASFGQALTFIERERADSDLCLVALDQPTIVPNMTSSRPVDRIAGSLISWLGGGVQPANRSKLGMFDDAAPLWRFKEALGATEDPERARSASSGLFLIEVFPAIALPTLELAYFGPELGISPTTRTVGRHSNLTTGEVRSTRSPAARVRRRPRWSCELGGERARAIERPRKPDQDKLDAVICALVGYHWLTKPRMESIMIGDLQSGYIIAPASPDVRGESGGGSGGPRGSGRRTAANLSKTGGAD